MLRSILGLLLISLGLLWVIARAGEPGASYCWLLTGPGVVFAGLAVWPERGAR